MSRVEIPEAVITVAGAAVSGASVQVNVRSSGAAATVYTSATGGATNANPLSTDSSGRIEGWLEEGSYDLVVSGTGISTYTQRMEASAGVQSPGFQFTAAGDFVYASAANSGTRLAAGTSVQTMHSGSVPRWAQVTDEDVSSAASVSLSKLAVGAATSSQVMSVVAGVWAPRTISTNIAYGALATSFQMSSTGVWYNGPSVSLSAGTWMALSVVSFWAVGIGGFITARLWDSAASVTYGSSETGQVGGYTDALAVIGPSIVLSGATTIRVSAAVTAASVVFSAATYDNPVGANASQIMALQIA